MVQVSVTLGGMDRLLEVLEAGGEAAKHEVPRATYEVAGEAFAESQRQVPVETGALRSSGSVHQPEVSDSSVTVDITYGGASAPYAVYVHEDPDASHDAPTKYKFLEDPVKQIAPTFGERLAQAIVAGLS